MRGAQGAIRVYIGQPGDEDVWAPIDQDQHLHVPPAEKDFLTSSPGSPLVGWEPSEEQAPGKETLTDDFIDALNRLAGGAASQADPPEPRPEDDVESVTEPRIPAEVTCVEPKSTGSQLLVFPSIDFPGL